VLTSISQQSAFLKPHLITILMMYCPNANIVNFHILSWIHFCFKNTPKHGHSNLWGERPKNSPFPLGHVDPHLIHQCLGRPHSPSQTAFQLLHTLLHNYATKYTLVTIGSPTSTPKLPIPMQQSPIPVICLIHGPSQPITSILKRK